MLKNQLVYKYTIRAVYAANSRQSPYKMTYENRNAHVCATDSRCLSSPRALRRRQKSSCSRRAPARGRPTAPRGEATISETGRKRERQTGQCFVTKRFTAVWFSAFLVYPIFRQLGVNRTPVHHLGSTHLSPFSLQRVTTHRQQQPI